MSDQLPRRVEQACAELLASGVEITFDAAAHEATVGRGTLYRRPELRALVEDHRLRGREALTLTGLAVEIDQLRTGLHALAAKVRSHEETIRRLERRPPPGQD
jgi:hypothetical protein